MSLAMPLEKQPTQEPIVIPYRRDEPGYFVVLDSNGSEVAGSRRPVREGYALKRDNQIVFALTMSMDDDCEVVFRADGPG